MKAVVFLLPWLRRSPGVFLAHGLGEKLCVVALCVALPGLSCTSPEGDPLSPLPLATGFGPPETDCGSGADVFFEEVEPNEAAPNEVSFDGGRVVIEGRAASCSNDGQYQWTGDRDLFVFDLACKGFPRFTLDWVGGATDLDFNVMAPDILATDFLVVDYATGMASSDCKKSDVLTYGRVEVTVLCWEGDPADWVFTMSWGDVDGGCSGDDDDSASDDDDSASDDDDSASDDDDSGNAGRSTL